MDELLVFLSQYGLGIGIIAIVGIAVLGVLKYLGIFDKYTEDKRHIFYVGISAGLSVVASIVYLCINKQFDVTYIVALATSIFSLNQGFYAIFEATSLTDLFKMILEFIIKLIDKTANTKIQERIAKRRCEAAKQRKGE